MLCLLEASTASKLMAPEWLHGRNAKGWDLLKKEAMVHGWYNSSSGKEWEEGKREGGMEGQRDGGMGTSVHTSVLLAMFQGSYSTYLLPISYFFFTFKVSNTWEYLLWGTECGLVIMVCVYCAPQWISANSRNSLGTKWPLGVTERAERWASHGSCLSCLVHLHQQTQEHEGSDSPVQHRRKCLPAFMPASCPLTSSFPKCHLQYYRGLLGISNR